MATMAHPEPTMAAVEHSREVWPDQLLQLATGFRAAKHLFVANEIGLFDALASGPASLDDLAQRAGAPRRTVRILADALVALGVIERPGGQYHPGLAAERFLCRGGPGDLRPLLRFWNHISYPAWLGLEEAVRTGRAPAHLGSFTPEEQRIFSEGVEAITAAPAAALPAKYDFSRHRRLLDLGGGTGSWLLAIWQGNPALQATLFELPAAAAVARRRLATGGAAEHIAVAEGDFFADPIPEGHDAILLANVVHLFSPERNLALLQRVRAAAPGGARLLLADFWTDPSHTEPITAALLAAEFLVIAGDGDAYSDEEAGEWLGNSGWRPLGRRELAGPMSLLVAEAV